MLNHIFSTISKVNSRFDFQVGKSRFVSKIKNRISEKTGKETTTLQQVVVFPSNLVLCIMI